MATSASDPDFYFGYEPTPSEEYEQYETIALAEATAQALPTRVDLTPKMTPIKNQGSYGSCVGFAICAALEIVPFAAGVTQDEAERFIWYIAKANDRLGNPDLNRGTFISVGLAMAQTLGSCWERLCPYTDPLSRPSSQAFAAARNMKVTNVYRLPGNTLGDYKAMLSVGWPVIVGFDIFGDSNYQRTYLTGDYTRRTGIMRMPRAPIPGRTNGHAVLFVGYDDSTNLIKFKNSWGTHVGDRGYYYMPYEYLRFTRDAWVVFGQRISLPVLPAFEGVSITAVGAAASTNLDEYRISEGRQPRDIHPSQAP